jgi:ADP-ribose pyrophosphatase YjhB (NUDIX family)
MTVARIDYYDDPDAPAANSLVPSANVIALDDAGRVLVIHRTDNDNWAVPGGAMDLGETLSACAIRETKEETGVDIEITGLVGIFTDPKHIIFYTSDGEARQEFSVLFLARAVGGEPTPSDESREVVWVERSALAGLTMDRSMRFRLQHWLDGHTGPYLS